MDRSAGDGRAEAPPDVRWTPGAGESHSASSNHHTIMVAGMTAPAQGNYSGGGGASRCRAGAGGSLLQRSCPSVIFHRNRHSAPAEQLAELLRGTTLALVGGARVDDQVVPEPLCPSRRETSASVTPSLSAIVAAVCLMSYSRTDRAISAALEGWDPHTVAEGAKAMLGAPARHRREQRGVGVSAQYRLTCVWRSQHASALSRTPQRSSRS